MHLTVYFAILMSCRELGDMRALMEERGVGIKRVSET